MVDDVALRPRAPVSSEADPDPAWEIIDHAPPRYSRPGMASYEFAKQLWTVPEVLAVTHAVDRGVNLIWTVIARRDKATRLKIYEQELQLMREYPDLTFNFHVAALGHGASESVMRDMETRLVMCRQPRIYSRLVAGISSLGPEGDTGDGSSSAGVRGRSAPVGRPYWRDAVSVQGGRGRPASDSPPGAARARPSSRGR